MLRASARVELAGNRGTLARRSRGVEPAVTLSGPLPRRRKKGEPDTTKAALNLRPTCGSSTAWAASRRMGASTSSACRGANALPPAPWVNVIANPAFGFLTSESGLGCTWAGNSQMHRLTPWNNDPISDPPGEVVYLRDEDSGDVWSPTPRPCGGPAATVVRHGQGYTSFTRNSHGLAQEMLVLAAANDPVKLIVLRLRNTGDGPRRLSATYYAEWVLGGTRDRALLSVRTEIDPESGALLARNAFLADFRDSVAFAHASERPRRRPPTAPISSAATAPWTSPRPCFAPTCPAHRRGTRPVRRPASGRRSGGGRGAGDRFPARRAPRTSAPSATCSASTRPRGGTGGAGGSQGAGNRCSARCRCARPTRRWTCCSTAGCFIRC